MIFLIFHFKVVYMFFISECNSINFTHLATHLRKWFLKPSMLTVTLFSQTALFTSMSHSLKKQEMYVINMQTNDLRVSVHTKVINTVVNAITRSWKIHMTFITTDRGLKQHPKKIFHDDLLSFPYIVEVRYYTGQLPFCLFYFIQCI